MIKKATFDICIMGGGITGLWALNRLKDLGYSAVLFETKGLGGGQTICSQGIIHGGLKYALSGFLTKSSDSIEDMPKRWKSCLEGKGEIDLRAVNILSKDQLLWSTGSLTSDLSTFFASKALKSRIQTLKRNEYPYALQNPAFKGNVYRLEEIVLDVPSLIKTLSEKYKDSIFKIDKVEEYRKVGDETKDCKEENKDFKKENNSVPNIKSLIIQTKNETLEIEAQSFLFSAGEGNEGLTKLCGIAHLARMQCRPLHMVVVALPEHYPLYGHCIDNGSNPRITITSHSTENGSSVWYLGGQLAEDGIERTTEEQISLAKQELIALFPWLNLTQAKFSSFFINRAEAYQKDHKRPESFYLEQQGNVFIAWPTKLALAPLLSEKLIKILKKQDILPNPNLIHLKSKEDFPVLEYPHIAIPAWDLA